MLQTWNSITNYTLIKTEERKIKIKVSSERTLFLINCTESIIKGCLPFAINGAFSGVLCADILFSELVADILYIKQEEFSYACIIDGEERTLVHPLLPDPRDVEATDQDIINIYNFETAGDVSQVIDSMKKKVYYSRYIPLKVSRIV